MEAATAMRERGVILLCALCLVSGCEVPQQPAEVPVSDGMRSYKDFAAGIKAYPYEAPQSRKERIIRNFPTLEIGMTKDQVADVIGDPDFSQNSYGPKGPNMKWGGSTWEYYLAKRDDSANESDPCVFIAFGQDDRANWILPCNIDGLIEMSSWGHPR
jgi:hypothetical protein